MAAMHLSDATFALLSALIVGQALMLAVLLAADRIERSAHGWLILALIAIALNSAGDAVEQLRLWKSFEWLAPAASGALFVMGPALWLYARALSERGNLPRRAALHFLPAALLIVLLAIEVLTIGLEDIPREPQKGDLPTLVVIAAHIGLYLFLAVARVRQIREKLKDECSTLDGRALDWLLVVVALVGLVVVIWVTSSAAEMAFAEPLTAMVTIIALALVGVYGVRQRNVFARLDPAAGAEPTVAASSGASPDSAPTDEVVDVAAPPKYARSALPEHSVAALYERLRHIMLSDKPYLENDLTLAELARYVDTKPHQLSQFFSQHLGETFYDYVNRHRVEAVKATLERANSRDRPLLEIALECGFRSKSTFNDTFRRLTGLSPSEYRRRLRWPPTG